MGAPRQAAKTTGKMAQHGLRAWKHKEFSFSCKKKHAIVEDKSEEVVLDHKGPALSSSSPLTQDPPGCLKPRIVLNRTGTTFFAMHTYAFSLKGSTSLLLFGTSKVPTSPLLHFGAILSKIRGT